MIKPIPKSSTVRIIGGKWRSRKITFATLPGVRPTPDRVRETLFNWLTPVIRDAQCLDLFAGSGALGFEALSRGAAKVVMVDQEPEIITMLKQNAEKLQTQQIEYIHGDFPNIKLQGTFNIVFLDPPFHKNIIPACAEWLERNQLLAPDALVYIEAEKDVWSLHLPSHWQVKKQQTAGQVQYLLAQISKNA